MDRATYQIEAELQHRHWWFRGRRRILERLLAGLDPPPRPGARVLDVGSGTGANAAVLGAGGRAAFALDREPLALALSSSQAYAARICADATRLPLADDSFDLVVSLDLLEHLEDDGAGARELARVLAPGGALVVFVPALRILWGLQDDVAHHRRRYRRRELASLMEGAGVAIERLTYFNAILFAPILVARTLMRAWRPPSLESENQIGGPVSGAVAGALFGLEAPLLRAVDLPFGVSLACIGRKKSA